LPFSIAVAVTPDVVMSRSTGLLSRSKIRAPSRVMTTQSPSSR